MKLALILATIFTYTSLFSAETGVISGSGATGEKPQSKAWFAQGKWWCCLGGKIFKKSGSGFTQVQTITTSTSYLADAKWDGTHLMLLLASKDASSAQFYKLDYNSAQDNYTVLSGFPVSLSLGGSAETITFDVDGNGQIFASFETGGRVKVIWTTDPDYKVWNTSGTSIGSGLASDDISATAALSDGRMGVLWSNQNDRKFHFRMHVPGTSETTWTAVEICNTGYSSDDHINLAVTPDGRVYAAVKTSGGGATHLLLERESSGTWNTYPVSPTGGTRPGVMYSREKDEILFYYNTAEGTSPVVLYRVVCNAIVLNSPSTIISNSDARNVSGTKQVLDSETGCLILAQKGRSGVTSAYYYYIDLEKGTTAGETEEYGMGLEKDLQIRAHPNPFYLKTTIKFNGYQTEMRSRATDLQVEIFDVNGRRVKYLEFDPCSKNLSQDFAFTWTPGDLSGGTYILKLVARGRYRTGKIFYCR